MNTLRYVAMIDILGFRDLVRKRPITDIATDVDQLFSSSGDHAIGWSSLRPAGRECGIARAGRAYFSDTILVWTAPVRFEDEGHVAQVLAFSKTIADLVLHGFISGLPLRGAIAYGECLIDESKHLFVGQPIIDAHELEAQQEWIGVAIHPSAEGGIAQVLGWWVPMICVCEYPVPMKQTATAKPDLAIDWTFGMQWPMTHRTMRHLYQRAEREYLARQGVHAGHAER
jgi:hypothetical protein